MKQLTFRWPTFLLIGLVLCAGAVVLKGISCDRQLLTLHTKIDKAWISLAADYQKRDSLASQFLAAASANSDFDQAAVHDADQARAHLMASIDVRKAPETDEAFDRLASAQGTYNQAMAKILRTTLMTRDLKMRRAITPSVVALIECNGRLSFASNAFEMAVQSYDAALQHFPAKTYASALGFTHQVSFTEAKMKNQTLVSSTAGTHE